MTAEDYGRYVDEAVVELQGILKTFSALLRISEVEDGIRRSGFVPVDLSAVAQDAIEFYEPFAEDRQVEPKLYAADKVQWGTVDGAIKALRKAKPSAKSFTAALQKLIATLKDPAAK